MKHKKSSDLISKVCGGEDEQYDRACEYFEELTRHCILLRDGRMEEIWKHERCPSYEFLEDALEREFSKKYGKRYPYHSADEASVEDVDFGKIVRDINRSLAKRKENTGKAFDTPMLPAWKNYLKSTASNYVWKKLFPKRQCGSCKYLSESKVCGLREIVIRGKPQENPYYGKKRKKTDPPCRNDKFHYAPLNDVTSGGDRNQLADPNPADTESSVIHKDIISVYSEWLRERAETAKKNSKKKKKFMHQYLIFKGLYKLLREHSQADAKKILRKKYGISKSTFDRYFREIREFLSEKMIQNGQ